jgi:GT2 family glycosyltransferase
VAVETDIIIPHYGVNAVIEALAVECLQSIRAHSSDYRVILVDNGSPVSRRVAAELVQHEHHLLIRNSQNLGFVRATNQGLRASSAPYVVLMNNDARAVEDWLEKLKSAFKTTDVGLAGPRTTTSESWQGKSKCNGTVLLSKDAMLAFFCVMIKRAVIETIGLLDESYGVGLGDDDSYCMRAQRAGFRLALVGELVIPHAHRSTFRALYTEAEIRDLQTRALEKFKRERDRS